MIDRFEIKGGAGEYEAAVLAGVVDRIRRRQEESRARRPKVANHLSAWMRAGRLTATDPMPRPDPGLNGDRAFHNPPEVPRGPRRPGHLRLAPDAERSPRPVEAR